MPIRTVRTTLTLPDDLLRATDAAIRRGPAQSRSEFVATALRHELAAGRRAAIDAAFAGMAGDPEAQNEARAVAGEVAAADWEEFQTAEPMP